MNTIAERISHAKLLRLEYVVYATAFLIPLALRHPQPVVGSVVNALLFIAAARLPRKHLIPLAILPSVSVILNNVLFGTLTPFLLILAPFIWAGNWVMMAVYASATNIHPVLRAALAIILKVALLFTVASIFVNLHIIPAIFQTAMGVFQLITAVIGAVIAFAVLKLTSLKTPSAK